MNRIQNASFWKELRSVVLPIAIENFMLALVSATDAVMLRLIDQNSMAAVSLAGQVQFGVNLLFVGFCLGLGVMAAQYWGKRDTEAVAQIAPVGLKIVLLLGGTVMLTAWFAPQWLMSILTNDPELIRLGGVYLHTVAPSYLLCGITQIYFALLKNTGGAAKSSAVSSFAVILNIVLNGILIFGLLGFPALGVRGAALATVITRAVELLWAVLANRRSGHVQLQWKRLAKRANRVLLGDYIRYSVPFVGAGLVWGVAFMLYSIIMGHLGSDAVAANSVTSIAKTLISCLIKGLGTGAGIMVGNLLGANQLDLAKQYGARLTRLAGIAGACTGGLLILISPLLVRFAALTDASSGYLQIMLVFCGFNIMAQAVNHAVLDGIFGAGGDAKFDMYTNIFAMWCFSVPLGLLAAFVWKLPVPVVYCIVNLDEIVKLPAVFIHYRKYIWLRNITREI